MSSEDNQLEHRRRKLKFRAWHRGTKEMDFILGGYADEHLWQMDDAEMDVFSHMLEAPDDLFYSWVSGGKETPAEYDNEIMQALKTFRMTTTDFTKTD